MDSLRTLWGYVSYFLAVIACLISCILQLICQDEVDFKEQKDVHEDQGQRKFLQNTNIQEATTKCLRDIMTGLMGSIFQKEEIRLHKMVTGNDMNCHKAFLKGLGISCQDAEFSVDQSDVIIAFVPIASRAGTDIEVALKKIPENRPVIFVALHHTFDRDYVVPESRRNISRSNMLAVDCLFYEDQGLLECPRNTEALKAASKYLQDIKMNSKVSRWY